ncbi:ferredoxin reductase family protein [Primorskyibacter aestuariivivens]|uniref:ferredoxin reductase family protein n=1 Tax=Primorskyibacter aestuariivivens TaxID=1888912 RepID=UPI002301209D|nr:ferredoxin reductase family protein [Primorskyibacter aestuariivivens]MDA7428841.1 ferredoxin reductase family protein [Primorskyibacter aestuariivivens]
MKPLLLILIYLVAVTLPLILSWVTGGPPRPVLQEIASGLGILAYAMILAEFVLSGRFKSVSNSVGMDVAIWFHQMLARVALVFALLHPFLYGGTPSGGTRPWDPTRALTVTTDFTALASGIAAFALLPALVLFAVHRDKLDYNYETWRLMHGIGAVVIALALLHHAVYAGRYGGHPVMVWVWIILTGIAVASLVYFYLLVPLRARGKPWCVTSVTQLTPRQWEVTVAPQKGGGLRYHAGQFAWLNIGHSAFSLHENPFSIASAPASGPEVTFMIKELGDFTRTIGGITPGTVAYVDGAYGNLSVDGRSEPGVALIAGGIGIAPLIGILRQMRLTGDTRKVRVIYGNRSEEQITCRDELAAEDVTYVLSEPPPGWTGESGMISPTLLDRVFTPEEMRDWVFVMCGPGAMLDMVEDHLIARGAPSDRILSERFQYD